MARGNVAQYDVIQERFCPPGRRRTGRKGKEARVTHVDGKPSHLIVRTEFFETLPSATPKRIELCSLFYGALFSIQCCVSFSRSSKLTDQKCGHLLDHVILLVASHSFCKFYFYLMSLQEIIFDTLRALNLKKEENKHFLGAWGGPSRCAVFPLQESDQRISSNGRFTEVGRVL